MPATPAFMQPGNRTGTPNYMAPEVVRRRPTDQRLDIFAFGVSAYEMLTFELPWQRGSGDGHGGHVARHARADPHRGTAAYDPPALAKAVMQCLAADVDQRPESMEPLSPGHPWGEAGRCDLAPAKAGPPALKGPGSARYTRSFMLKPTAAVRRAACHASRRSTEGQT